MKELNEIEIHRGCINENRREMHQTGQERYRLYSYREVEMQIEIQDREEEKGGGERIREREQTDQ